MNLVDSLREGLSGLFILEDESIKQGDFSKIDKQASIHFLVSPFLSMLGYNMFNMREIRLGYEVSGVVSDVTLFDSEKALAVLRIVPLADRERFAEDELDFVLDDAKGLEMGVFDSTLIVLTNGLDYRLYMKKSDRLELLKSFDLYSLRDGEDADLTLVTSLLHRQSLVNALDRPMMLSEILVKTMYGRLLGTDYVKDALFRMLSNPSEMFFQALAKEIMDVHFESTFSDELVDSLIDEYTSTPINFMDVIGDVSDNTVTEIEETAIEETAVEETAIEETAIEETTVVESEAIVGTEDSEVTKEAEGTEDTASFVGDTKEDTNVTGTEDSFGFGNDTFTVADTVSFDDGVVIELDVANDVVDVVGDRGDISFLIPETSEVEEPSFVEDTSEVADDEVVEQAVSRDPFADWREILSKGTKTDDESSETVNEANVPEGDSSTGIDTGDTGDDENKGMDLGSLLS